LIDVTFLDPSLIENIQDMLQLSILCCDRPPKALAADLGYSVNAIYGALTGERSIPAKARRKLSQLNFIAAATVALESTGFTKLFGYQKVDRHVQSMILRYKRQSKENDSLINDLPILLLDKNSREDLTSDDLEQVTFVACKLIDLANLIMELEVRYKLGFTQYLQDKEKSPVLAHRRLSN
jgi:hypothetical protein